MSLDQWTPRQRPQRIVLDGRFARLEPFDPKKHGDQLYDACTVPDAEQRFQYLQGSAPKSREEFDEWSKTAAASEGEIHFAVIDKSTGRVGGRQKLFRIDEAHGVVELGGIYWGPLLSQTSAATEAQFLCMKYVFETLGYRRYEWKCDSKNYRSKRAAERFGFKFEGIFRQHMVIKGRNRDTAWFSVIDSEWTVLKPAYEAWLSPENFDSHGAQLKRLEDFYPADFRVKN